MRTPVSYTHLFTNAADVSVKYGLESALRTELLAHTATGWVYVCLLYTSRCV